MAVFSFIVQGFDMVVWKDIPKYEGHYQVSNYGQVKSLARMIPNGRGGQRKVAERILAPAIVSGYKCVLLSKNGETEYRKVHHLVLEAFVGPRPEGMVCRHFPDSDKGNNCLDNLQWGTHGENVADKLLQGTHREGENHHNSKLTDAKALEIIYAVGTLKSIGDKYGVNLSTVGRLKKGQSWKHLPRD